MTISEKCRTNTENFLRSYLIQKKLSEVSGFDESLPQKAAAVSSEPVNAFDDNLLPGQIRLLADIDRLTYILLLRRWDEDSFVVTAFSHYDYPATDEEMMLGGYTGAYLNTLQLWNTRTLQDKTLKKSWLCGQLSEQICQDAWLFWTSLINGQELPASILEKTGTAITDPEDIRLLYLQEEAAVFASVDAADLNEEDNEELSEPNWFGNRFELPSLWKNEEEVLAAGPEAENIRINCRINDYEETIIAEYSPEEKTLWLSFFTADGSGFSSAFDGAEIITEDAHTLGTVSNGRCRIEGLSEFDGHIGLRDPHGIVYTFEPTEM